MGGPVTHRGRCKVPVVTWPHLLVLEVQPQPYLLVLEVQPQLHLLVLEVQPQPYLLVLEVQPQPYLLVLEVQPQPYLLVLEMQPQPYLLVLEVQPQLQTAALTGQTTAGRPAKGTAGTNQGQSQQPGQGLMEDESIELSDDTSDEAGAGVLPDLLPG
ncbi:hypothetical protein QJQ45_011754 [Haematococcus lacustris]|nr:hypothetical protein QJQ45_011754 [Haematococcus lacustris]